MDVIKLKNPTQKVLDMEFRNRPDLSFFERELCQIFPRCYLNRAHDIYNHISVSNKKKQIFIIMSTKVEGRKFYEFVEIKTTDNRKYKVIQRFVNAIPLRDWHKQSDTSLVNLNEISKIIKAYFRGK